MRGSETQPRGGVVQVLDKSYADENGHNSFRNFSIVFTPPQFPKYGSILYT